MKTYIIRYFQTDEILGEVIATSILNAELKACGIWSDVRSEDLIAFTKEQ